MHNRHIINPLLKYYITEKNITHYNVTNLPVLEIYNRQCLVIYAITFVCINSLVKLEVQLAKYHPLHFRY